MTTTDRLREALEADFRRAVLKEKAAFQGMIAKGATPRKLALMLVTKILFDHELNQSDHADAVCKMALDGEFDCFFSELLAVSQN